MKRIFYIIIILLASLEVHTQEKVEVKVIPGDASSQIIIPINNIRIGGRNYVKNSAFLENYSGWYISGDCFTEVKDGIPTIGLNRVGHYTESGYIRCPQMDNLMIDEFTLSFLIYSLNGFVKVDFDGDYDNSITTTVPAHSWQKVVIHVNAGKIINSLNFSLYGSDEMVMDGWVTRFKLEYGNQATDWTPALDDTDAAIVSLSSELSLIPDKIATAIKEIHIGGRNLILNSKNITSRGVNPGLSFTTTNVDVLGGDVNIVTAQPGNGNWLGINLPLSTLPYGKQVTFSFKVYGLGTGGRKPKFYTANLGSYKEMEGYVADGAFTTLSITYTFIDSGDSSFALGFGDCIGIYHMKEFKLEYGNQTTDWTPAPEDITQKLSALGVDEENKSMYLNKLDVNGTIRAKEIKVESTGWADFVFDDNYNLPSLEIVSSHIKEHKHLPNIPSASEVAENGISIGEMNAKLLQKIEELTLYVIRQQEEINELKLQIKK